MWKLKLTLFLNELSNRIEFWSSNSSSSTLTGDEGADGIWVDASDVKVVLTVGSKITCCGFICSSNVLSVCMLSALKKIH